MCCADQAIFVRFLFEVCWLLSFFSPEVPVQGELVRARGFRSRAFNSALARLAGCRARGGLPTRAPRPDDSRQVSGFAVGQACGAWGLARRAEPNRRAKKKREEIFSGAVVTAPHQRAHQRRRSQEQKKARRDCPRKRILGTSSPLVLVGGVRHDLPYPPAKYCKKKGRPREASCPFEKAHVLFCGGLTRPSETVV